MNTSTDSRAVRRAARFATVTAMFGILAGAAVLASPAQASVPDGWSNPADVDPLHAIALLAGVPLLLFVVIALAVYLPSLARGEKFSGGAAGPDPEWFGGPRKGNDELAAPDTAESQAGGASGQW
ncbi:hypothetical protein [Nocardioides jensenii]|uniref:hypothetical protein n=1 Tax=Nocardioides jensenii TaxID=1843 RepID=UPI00082C772A|nr:hypothetical protein [Nocardioides jensenii]